MDGLERYQGQTNSPRQQKAHRDGMVFTGLNHLKLRPRGVIGHDSWQITIISG